MTSLSRALAVVSGARAALAAATSVRKIAAATAAIGAGMLAAWLASGRVGILAGMAVLLAAGNGYAKAYSP